MITKPRYLNIRGNLIDLSLPRVMGVINVTPDSFYIGSRYMKEAEIMKAAHRMIEEGADFLDVGGFSSRPGASKISFVEEMKRVTGAIKLINREIPEAVISVDTFRSDIAREAIVGCGASLINDISGGEADERMFEVVEQLQVPYIMMHMQGMPWNMQKNPSYDDVVADILRWFSSRIHILQSAGVKDIIIDPGFGFGKTLTHNFELLKRLGDFSVTGLPLMAGISRKSMIWKTLDITPSEALNGTSVLNTVAILNGADILRVHDVKEAVQTIKLIEKVKNRNPDNGT